MVVAITIFGSLRDSNVINDPKTNYCSDNNVGVKTTNKVPASTTPWCWRLSSQRFSTHHIIGGITKRVAGVRGRCRPADTVRKSRGLYHGKSLVRSTTCLDIPYLAKYATSIHLSVLSVHTCLWKVQKISTECPSVFRYPTFRPFSVVKHGLFLFTVEASARLLCSAPSSSYVSPTSQRWRPIIEPDPTLTRMCRSCHSLRPISEYLLCEGSGVERRTRRSDLELVFYSSPQPEPATRQRCTNQCTAPKLYKMEMSNPPEKQPE